MPNDVMPQFGWTPSGGYQFGQGPAPLPIPLPPSFPSFNFGSGTNQAWQLAGMGAYQPPTRVWSLPNLPNSMPVAPPPGVQGSGGPAVGQVQGGIVSGLAPVGIGSPGLLGLQDAGLGGLPGPSPFVPYAGGSVADAIANQGGSGMSVEGPGAGSIFDIAYDTVMGPPGGIPIDMSGSLEGINTDALPVPSSPDSAPMTGLLGTIIGMANGFGDAMANSTYGSNSGSGASSGAAWEGQGGSADFGNGVVDANIGGINPDSGRNLLGGRGGLYGQNPVGPHAYPWLF